MNIHIITFHRALNYGAVLQAYALYRSAANLAPAGSGVFILDHKNSHIDQLYSLLPSGAGPRAFARRSGSFANQRHPRAGERSIASISARHRRGLK